MNKSGTNTDFEAKPAPKDGKVVYSLSLPELIHLNEDLFVDVALKHKYGIIKVINISR